MIDWNMAKENTNMIQTKDTLKKLKASLYTFWDTHISFNNNGVIEYQILPKNNDTTTTIIKVWAATWLTIFSFFAPAYWAINVDHAIAKPLQSEIIKKVIGKLTETDATASHPSLHTQNASVSW